MDEVIRKQMLSTKRGGFVDETRQKQMLSTKRGCFVDKVSRKQMLSTKRGCFVDESELGAMRTGNGACWEQDSLLLEQFTKFYALNGLFYVMDTKDVCTKHQSLEIECGCCTQRALRCYTEWFVYH